MARKKRGRPVGRKNKPKLEAAAQTVGRTLGSVMAKVDAWMVQREQIARELRAAADRIMSGDNPFGWGPSGKTAAALPAKASKRRRMSKEARERIAAAQRARWAKQKAAHGGATGKGKKAAKKSGGAA